MDHVLDLLQQVPSDSQDAPAAQEMVKRITEGRAARLAREAEIKKDLDTLRQAPPPGTFRPDSPAPPAPPTVPTPANAGADAGPAKEPVPGMALAEFKSRWGDCFSPGEPVNVAGVGSRDTWLLSGGVRCQQALPGYDARAVVTDATKVLTVIAKSAVVHLDAGAPPPTEPTPPQPAPPPPPAPAPQTPIPALVPTPVIPVSDGGYVSY
jgi:hypothetical protein